jgi:hypothetical protein
MAALGSIVDSIRIKFTTILSKPLSPFGTVAHIAHRRQDQPAMQACKTVSLHGLTSDAKRHYLPIGKVSSDEI